MLLAGLISVFAIGVAMLVVTYYKKKTKTHVQTEQQPAPEPAVVSERTYESGDDCPENLAVVTRKEPAAEDVEAELAKILAATQFKVTPKKAKVRGRNFGQFATAHARDLRERLKPGGAGICYPEGG